MNIYKLEPIDLNYAGWRYSVYRGPALIRAESEKAARLEAAKGFGIAAEIIRGQDTACEPWTYPAAVSATIVTSSIYPKEGGTAILEPKEKY